MGIINVTPDSFSGDGVIAGNGDHVAVAVAQARQMVADGADLIDIGAESTRPGAEATADVTERARLIPVVTAIGQAVPCPISVDTRNARTAASALDAGASIINDVSALTHDPEMRGLAAQRKAPVVLMHNAARGSVQRAALGPRYVEAHYDDVVTAVSEALRVLTEQAKAAGIASERIVIDPGIGFGKTVEQSLALLNRLDHLRDLGFPILLGSSRKSFIGYTLSLPVDQRSEGTAATVAIGIARGAAIIRVHDVQAMARVARMTDAILAAG